MSTPSVRSAGSSHPWSTGAPPGVIGWRTPKYQEQLLDEPDVLFWTALGQHGEPGTGDLGDEAAAGFSGALPLLHVGPPAYLGVVPVVSAPKY
jgi:hypothetical protein